MSDVKKTEEEIKEEARKELIAEQEKIEKKQRRNRSVVRIVLDFIFTIIFLFVLFETVMGVLDMQKINEDQDPIWYIDSKVEEVDNKKITSYNLGLYVIEKVESNTEKKVGLKPFFIK